MIVNIITIKENQEPHKATLPILYKNKKVFNNLPQKILNKMTKGRKEVNGLVCNSSWMPSIKCNNGWGPVLRKLERKENISRLSFEIITQLDSFFA